MLISQIRISDQNKETVYQHFSKDQDVVIFDRSYFANKWVSAINDDFYLILYISSFLIFFALWFSYGRIELTLMSFLPMLVSWVIILGLMGILGIEFNIINIILSTFIFGIGDDFSIFIMDGLQNKYRTGQKVLNSHKTAIFFSAFTTVVGMGALVFAKHPALQSISLISILGMIAVVLVAYHSATHFPVLHCRTRFQRIAALYAYRADTDRIALPAFLYRLYLPPCTDRCPLFGACAEKQQTTFGMPTDTNHLQRDSTIGHCR